MERWIKITIKVMLLLIKIGGGFIYDLVLISAKM